MDLGQNENSNSQLESKYNRYFYSVDEQGSTVFITDTHQNIRNEYYYDAFGNILDSKEKVHNRITYTGQQFDGITGQYYLRARFYNPVIGRFTQEDIYRGDGLNLYAYCANNPIIYYDPSGYAICPENKQRIFDEYKDLRNQGLSATEAYNKMKAKGVSKASSNKIFSSNKIEWTATRPKGTQQTYEIYQRNDIDWDMIKTSGDKNFIGKTNAEAAISRGLAPQLSDGNFATLHHIGQDSRGALAEASTRYHGVGKYGQDILHSQYGRSIPNPNFPIDRSKFGVDTREYWKWRVGNK
ncbi:RHS repeat-associated core domain-containing protein [Clostridium sp. OS1-26]|uniref:RHS repeat-associated core domain-containing protein n=1 Tax=Clostridium sp. OS1-26 TaxID=3070681 RepID=UPI0035A88B3B